MRADNQAIAINDVTQQHIYHIAEPERWHEAQVKEAYASPSLATEGFIHCSTRPQVQRSLDKFFRDSNAVIVLEIDTRLLHSELRYEPADGDSFPHIYGALNVSSVVAVTLVTRGSDGVLAFADQAHDNRQTD